MTTRPLLDGLTAGAVGTAVLNTVTYLDMVVRDRPSSDVPARTAERATDLVGITLAVGRGAQPPESVTKREITLWGGRVPVA